MPDSLHIPYAAASAVAEHLTSLYAEIADEDAAVEEALGELEAGQGRPLAAFSEEFSARFAACYGAK